MKAKTYNISFTRGDTYTLSVGVKTNLADIKGIFFTVKDENGENKIISKKLDNGVTLNDNIILVTIKPTDTNELSSDADYIYDLQINYGIDDVWTPLKGTFKVDGDVTRPADEV